jgi:hypothetical protein
VHPESCARNEATNCRKFDENFAKSAILDIIAAYDLPLRRLLLYVCYNREENLSGKYYGEKRIH